MLVPRVLSHPPLSLTGWLRYDIVTRLLPPGDHRILEIGAGLGSFGARLAERYEYVGIEPDPISFATAARRVGSKGRVLNCMVEDLPHTEMFDIVCSFEVLEHIDDDEAALASWLRHLRAGGWVLLSVPRGSHRFGAQDEWVGHFRRYDREDLERILVRAGVSDVEILAYGFPLGNVLEETRSIVARLRPAKASHQERSAVGGRWLQPPAWAGVVTQGLTLPLRLLQRPFLGTELGTGLVARGRLTESSSR